MQNNFHNSLQKPRVWLCVCVYIYIHNNANIHLCIDVHIHVCEYVCVSMCVCVCVYGLKNLSSKGEMLDAPPFTLPP